MRVRHGIDVRRIGIGAIAITVVCGAVLAASVVATRSDAATDTGPMAARVIEANNNGIPADVVARFERVRAKLAEGSPDHWAGEYSEGDGLGENVTLAVEPGTGVAMTWFGCLGLYGANEGDVDAVDDRTLSFRLTRPNGSGPIGTFPSAVSKVTWGERRYLIDPNHYVDFVNAINDGLEPDSVLHSHLFLLARGDAAKPAAGLPDLPAEWLAQIREKPLLVTVSSVEPPVARGDAQMPRCLYRFRFDVPDGETLPVGTDLRSRNDDSRDTATIVAIDGREATAKIEIDEACSAIRNPPSPGSVFSTGSYTPR